MKRKWLGSLVPALGVMWLTACGGPDNAATPAEMEQAAQPAGDMVTLVGAGATFPYPVYSKWFATYGEQNPVRINYQSIGSGGGIRQITEGTVDFGASDAPMNADEMAKIPGILHLPTVLGAVAVAYNLPGVSQPIKLSGQVLADIYLGGISRWNDPRIAQTNPGVTLPDRDILVIYRSDGSGTSYTFTDYLSAVSPQFKQSVGVGKSVSWPVGLGAKGNEGVAGQVRQMEGSVGYVELAYAMQTGLTAAEIQNQSGQFVAPSVEATTAAAAGVAAKLGANPDFRISIVNAAGATAYPISTWTYLLVPSQMEDCTRARALAGVIEWALMNGGAQAKQLHYAPLPDNVRSEVLAKLNTVTCGPNSEPVTAG